MLSRHSTGYFTDITQSPQPSRHVGVNDDAAAVAANTRIINNNTRNSNDNDNTDTNNNSNEQQHEYYAGDDGARYTVDQAVDGAGFGKFQVMMLCFTGLAWMGGAMEMMLLSFLGPSVRCVWGVTPRQEGTLTSVVFVGMMFGAPT